jgi:hypothetical protein
MLDLEEHNLTGTTVHALLLIKITRGGISLHVFFSFVIFLVNYFLLKPSREGARALARS